MMRIGLRGVVAAALLAIGVAEAVAQQNQPPAFLPQGWSPDERQWFYTVSQGSQIMPYAWFMALERAADDKPFIGELAGFGYLPNANLDHNTDGLPVGFVKDVDPSNRSEWVGMNCSACHTNQVVFRGRLYQVDGAPTNADMMQLVDGMPRRWPLRHAERRNSVSPPRCPRYTPATRPASPTQEVLRLLPTMRSTAPSPVAQSARLDAFGIFNRPRDRPQHRVINTARCAVVSPPVGHPLPRGAVERLGPTAWRSSGCAQRVRCWRVRQRRHQAGGQPIFADQYMRREPARSRTAVAWPGARSLTMRSIRGRHTVQSL